MQITDLKRHNGWFLLILRIVVGVIFIAHGSLKWAMWGAGSFEIAPAFLVWLLRLLSIVEPVVGVLMILGVLVNYGAVIFAVIMVGAITFKISSGSVFVSAS